VTDDVFVIGNLLGSHLFGKASAHAVSPLRRRSADPEILPAAAASAAGQKIDFLVPIAFARGDEIIDDTSAEPHFGSNPLKFVQPQNPA
jgi:hypothetical protein